MTEESKIIELLKSYSEGQTMRIEALANSQTREDEHIRNIDSQIKMIMDRLSCWESKLDTLLDKLDKRYAPAMFGTLMSGLVAAILLAFVGALIVMVWPHSAQAVGLYLINLKT